MIHKMRLEEKAFEAIKRGEKDIEVRLNDPKRQKVKVGDIIEFFKRPELKEKLKVKVCEILPFETFEDLYDHPKSKYYNKFEKEHFLIGCYTIYSKELEKEHGVLGIRVKNL